MKKVIFISGILSSIMLPLIFIVIIAAVLGGRTNNNESIENMSLNQSQSEFVSKLLPGALKGYEKGLYPSITIAQAIHESAWGQSALASEYNNLFGVKADTSWTGPIIEMNTQEFINGQYITVVARWRVYEKWEDSILAHGKFLRENIRYEQAGVFSAKNYEEQAKALYKAGYATDRATCK